MATAFCVLSTWRTGSQYLCSLLDSHPQLCCHRELFDQTHTWIDATQEHGLPFGPAIADQESRAREPNRWLDAVIAESIAHDPSWRAIGFKLHLLHKPSVLERILFEPGFSILLLDRADRLAQYGSSKTADATFQYRLIGTDKSRSVTVPFDLAEFETFTRRHEDLYHMVRAVTRDRTDVLELDYDLLLEPSTHRRALAFLGVDPMVTLTAPERKQHRGHVLARFTNPHDVVAALRQTPWARWLPDGEATQ